MNEVYIARKDIPEVVIKCEPGQVIYCDSPDDFILADVGDNEEEHY